MKKQSFIGLGLILGLTGLAACSFQKKGETPEEVPSAGTTATPPEANPMAVQPTPPPQEGMAPMAPAAPEAAPPAPPAPAQ